MYPIFVFTKRCWSIQTIVMRILKSCVVYKFQAVNPACPPSPLHTFWSTAIRRDIRAVCIFQLLTALT